MLPAGEARLTITARRAEPLRSLATQLEAEGAPPVTRIPADITDQGDLARIAAGAEDALGQVDILVNCAGASRPTTAAVVEHASKLPAAGKAPDDVDRKIAAYVLPMVHDGACVQFGVGAVPNIIAAALKDRKDLGVHTELLSDGIASLIECGAVTNRRKTTDVAMGTAQTYDLINDNPAIECRMADYVNDPRVIGQNDNVLSVNAGE